MKRFVKVMALFAVFVLTLFIFDKMQLKFTALTPTTGFAVYEARHLQWAFDEPLDYSYDESLINLSSGEAKLRLQTILKELKNQIPLTIQQKDNGKYNKKLEFESAAYSYKGTLKTLSFNADKPPQTSVKLKIRTAGSQQALEGAEWQPSGKEYYTTSPQDIQNTNWAAGGQSGYVQYKVVLETDDNTKTPTLNSVTITYETEEYPAEASISTKDYVFSRSAEVHALATEEELRGQTVKYEYSTDSGNTWKEPVSGQILAAAADKIAIKATLGSNGAETPVVKDIKLSYRISVCDENWQAGYTGCSISDTRTKYYADANACGSTEDLPADNGTTESCDYCTPSWTETNGSSCGKDDIITATFRDANNCYETTGLQSDNNKPQNRTYSCDYCTPSFVCGGYSDCSGNNQKTCVQANDMNNCYSQTELSSDSYSGDYSEFTASCAYDTEKPSVNSAIAAGIGNTLTVMANITDKSPITAVAHITKDNNAVMNLTLTNTNIASGGASGIYAASANAAGLDGAYIVSILAKDSYGNAELAKGIAGLAINAERSAMKEIALNSTGKALIVLANSATIEVKGRAGPTEASTTGRIVVAEQTTDGKNTTKPQERKELGKYIEIEADETLKSNISSATLKISYTDEEVAAANISETSLAIYYYDEPSLLWQLLNSTANAALNYVEGNTTHLSLFGVFGNPQSQATAANATINQTTTNATANQTAPGGSEQQQQQQQETLTEQNAAVTAGGGGGAAEKSQADKIEQAQKEEEPATAETDRTGESCTYDVRLELAGNPPFINRTMTDATLANTGTCELQNIEIKATQPLAAYLVIENGKKAVLKPLESFGFAIKLKAAADAALQAQQQKQPVQGFVVKEPRKATTRNGKIVITGQGVKGLGLNTESGELQLKEEVPINIEVYELEQNGSKSSTAATAIGVLVLITLLGMLYNRVRQGKKDSGSSKNSEKEVSNVSDTAAARIGEEKAAVEKNLQEQQHEQEKGTPGFEEGLKRFEEKWKEQQNLFSEKSSSKTEQQQQNVVVEKGLSKTDEQQQQQNQHEKGLEGFRETFK